MNSSRSAGVTAHSVKVEKGRPSLFRSTELKQWCQTNETSKPLISFTCLSELIGQAQRQHLRRNIQPAKPKVALPSRLDWSLGSVTLVLVLALVLALPLALHLIHSITCYQLSISPVDSFLWPAVPASMMLRSPMVWVFFVHHRCYCVRAGLGWAANWPWKCTLRQWLWR